MPSKGGMELVPLHRHEDSYTVRFGSETRVWGGPHLLWQTRPNRGEEPIFSLTDLDEGGYWDYISRL